MLSPQLMYEYQCDILNIHNDFICWGPLNTFCWYKRCLIKLNKVISESVIFYNTYPYRVGGQSQRQQAPGERRGRVHPGPVPGESQG